MDEYLGRAPEGERDELADLIRTFLLEAPVPAYSDETLAAIQAEPATRKAAALLDEEAGLWPALLPRLRHRMKLKREEVVAQLAEMLGVGADAPKVRAYYHEMESWDARSGGGLAAGARRARADLRGVDGRAGGRPASIRWRSRPRRPSCAGSTGWQVGRSRAGRVDGVRLPGGQPEEWDEVDRLFRGGRDA